MASPYDFMNYKEPPPKVVKPKTAPILGRTSVAPGTTTGRPVVNPEIVARYNVIPYGSKILGAGGITGPTIRPEALPPPPSARSTPISMPTSVPGGSFYSGSGGAGSTFNVPKVSKPSGYGGPDSFVGGGGTVYNTGPSLAKNGLPAVSNDDVTSPTEPDTSLADILAALLNSPGPSAAPVGSISTPDLPRTDISGLYNQFSPSINSAYDQLIQQLTGSRAQQARSFGDIANRVTGSYAPARADVQQGTSQASNAVQELANRFGLGRTTQGEMGQRWAETAGRLENLAGQNQAAQLGSLDTLRNARDSMYDTFLSAAQGGRAGGLADFASQIATGQSNIDTARSGNLAQLAQAAMSGQLDLAKLAQSNQDSDFQRKMQVAGLGIDLQKLKMAQQEADAKAQAAMLAGLPQVTEETSTANPDFYQSIQNLSNPDARQLGIEAFEQYKGDPEDAIAALSARLMNIPNALPEGIPFVNKIPGISNLLPDKSQEKANLQLLIDMFKQVSPAYGGVSRNISVKNQRGG